jgi:hypothetical protein
MRGLPGIVEDGVCGALIDAPATSDSRESPIMLSGENSVFEYDFARSVVVSGEDLTLPEYDAPGHSADN